MTATIVSARRRLTPEKLEAARHLHNQNMTYIKIGQLLEVDSSTVWCALNPDRAKQTRFKRQKRLNEKFSQPRKVGHQFPWEGLQDDDLPDVRHKINNERE